MERLGSNRESGGNLISKTINAVIEVIRKIFWGGDDMMSTTSKPTSPKPSSPSEYHIPEQDWRF